MEHFTWQVVADGLKGPGRRSRHGLVFDRVHQKLILFGGADWQKRHPCRSDTWECRQGVWRELDMAASPAARHRGAMVFDALNGHSVLFGGQENSNAMLNDTWTLEEGKWRKRTGWFWSCPAPRCGHAMAFDERLGVTVLFGGIDPADEPLGDTWTFNGSRWKRVKGAASPSPRRYAAFAYHPLLNGCILHGGAYDDEGQETYGDTWLFRDGEWTPFSEEFDTTERDDHGLAYHEASQTMLMLEGLSQPRSVLAFRKSGWRPTEITPLHPRHQCSQLAYDSVLGGLVLHGGEQGHYGHQYDETLLLKLEQSLQ